MYFEAKVNANNLDRAKICILTCLTTYNTYSRSFQYKVSHNILFLNKKLYLFGITKRPLCSYCSTSDEATIHLFCECNSAKYLWLYLNRYFYSDLTFPVLTPQTVILVIFNDSVSNIHIFKIISCVHLLFWVI